MNWKRFLKPDWRKIVIGSVIGFILWNVLFPGINVMWLLFGWFYLRTWSGMYVYSRQIVGGIILPYLLSYLIFWVYDKRKKK